MKILMVSANYPPLLGGPASTVPYLSQKLSQNGFEVHVLTQGFIGYPKVSKKNGVFVHRCRSIAGYNYSFATILRKIALMSKLGISISKKYKIDIIHSHDPNISAVSGISSKEILQIPSMVKYSGDLVWEFMCLGGSKSETFDDLFRLGGMKLTCLKIIEKKIFDRYNRIMVMTKYQVETLKKFMGIDPRKIALLPNGLVRQHINPREVMKIREKIGSSDLLISTACRLVSWKGIKYLVSAMTCLPKSKLVIFGEGPEKKKLIHQTRKLGLSNRVVFYGKVPHEKIQTYIKATDVFVLPSLYDPSPNALLDAFAVQVPVVATNIGGIPEIVGSKAGILVEPRNAKAIADALSRIAHNEKIVDCIKENQKRIYTYFLWDNVIGRYIDVYEEMLGD